ncbi:MAG: [FeFe] hydrogenase H-cluster maturation GTPase HydF [Rikenellaceae bacterium]|jgi:[FeFe] hydrogenase H-cluster maturation GTPase HydF|nr:[FeFe] hydrogenase H-cluster maturation GTPase HydF [Rikenellaceae bacterium]
MPTRQTSSDNRAHIAIYGRCNAGKSTLLNFLTRSPAAIVSPHGGTTTDPVRKFFEILDFAPVVFIDTAGVDDRSPLGAERLRRTWETVELIDMAIVVFHEWGPAEEEIASRLRCAGTPYMAVRNVVAGAPVRPSVITPSELFPQSHAYVDLLNGGDDARDRLMELIKSVLPELSYRPPSIFAGLASEGDAVLLVCPIDSEAPTGRLILPQVQAIRELLDARAIAVVVQPAQIGAALCGGLTFRLVVTDSQMFPEVQAVLPQGLPLTSFSILLAAAKGDMELYTRGLAAIDALRDGDRVLVCESCNHQVSCEDIGRMKIPRWLGDYTGALLEFTVVSGLSPLPDDLPSYKLMLQCGGCMATRSQLRNHIRRAAAAGVAVTNYGMAIRKIRGKK